MPTRRNDTTIGVSLHRHQEVEDALIAEQAEKKERLTYDDFVGILLERSRAWKKEHKK